MKILLTNDDGYSSEGIKALELALGTAHEVWTLAPDSERSGMSHSMSLRHPLKIRKMAERGYSCSGTPADCVILAAHGVIPFVPDVVVSGINRGPNLGTDLIYSGTAAAARQATLNGIPGIAVSLATYTGPFRYVALANLVAERLEYLVSLWSPDVFINLNAPEEPDGYRYDIVEAFPSRRIYKDTIKFFEGPEGYSYCFFMDGHVDTHQEKGSDEDVVNRGLASVTRVLAYPRAAGGLSDGGSEGLALAREDGAAR
ncbi:MAG: 5'/3'-nucleotidase SurE [Spirochaetae bacterium HGW-Spirochaetae-3]|jgi:5'-nucleotidase|nr:MAG: 5'/3'-nucleotidase SurE [Spirochaetae bacterium HGW-Spirochaetae-3]